MTLLHRSFRLISIAILVFVPADISANDRPAADVTTPISTGCPHVRVLKKTDSALVEEQFRDSIIEPQSKQAEALSLALDALPPLVCRAVQKVVFVNAVLPSSPEAIAWVGRSRPDLLVISAVPGGASEARLGLDLETLPPAGRSNHVKVWPEVIHSIIHEAYHSAVHLIESFGPDYEGPENVWPAGTRSMAQQAVDRAKIRGGLKREWERVNDGFVSAGYGTDYDRSRQGRMQPPPKGFMTIYGGATPGEDIAETASWAVAKPLLQRQYQGYTPDVASWKYACPTLAAFKGIGIPADLAALYTKLSFLRDIGFITDDHILGCQGSGSVGLIGSGQVNGIRFFDSKNWRLLSTYDTDLKTTRSEGRLTVSAWNQLSVSGKNYRALAEIDFAIDEDKFPRGVYTIGQCNVLLPLGQVPLLSKVLFRRRVEGNNSQSICAYQAKVLVTRATTEHIEGSLFVEKVWKFSTPPVPETNGFPVNVVFSVKN